MANATSTQLQELYVAYFGRAADPTGLDYWKESGITTAAFAANMYAQPEFKSAYGSLSTESQVNQIYKNLFDREADVTGLTYWTQQIKLGNLQLAEIANHLIWAAQNNAGSSDDKTALTNRTNAAVAYTAKIKESTAAILAYQPLDSGLGTTDFSAGLNITEAISFLSGIDKDTTYTAANLAASVATITTNGIPEASAKTYTLTSNTDTFAGTSSKDIFQGVVVGAATTGTTLTSGDSVVGGGGVDTLNISATGGSGAGGVGIEGINADVEKIFFSNFDTDTDQARLHTFNASLSDGVTTVGLSSSGDNGDTVFSNLQGITNAEMKNGSADLTISHTDTATSGDSDSATLTLSGAIKGATVVPTFTETAASAAGGLETLTVTSTGSANNVAITSGQNSLETLNVNGDQDLTTTVTSTSFKTVNASTFTGKLDLTYSGAVDLTLTGGSGDDTFTFSTNDFTSADTVDGGAGTDVLAVSTDITAATFLKNVSNIETLKIAGSGAQDVTLAADANVMNFDFTSAGANKLTLNTGVAGAVSVTLGETGADQVDNPANVALTVKGEATAIETSTLIRGGSGTDVLEITADTEADAAINISTQNVTKFETITIVDAGDATTGSTKLSGKDVNLTTGSYATALTIDGSALDAANVDDASGANSGDGIDNDDTSAEILTVDGSSATGVLTITGGGAGDALTGGTVNDIIDGGGGNDTITATAGGNDNVKGGAGDDIFIFGATLTKDDTVDGGAGTDTLRVTSLTAANLAGVTGVETLAFTGTTTLAADLSFDTIDLTTGSDTDKVTFTTGYAKATTVKVEGGDTVVNNAKITLSVTGAASEFESGDSTVITGSSSTTNDSLTITTSGEETADEVVTSSSITNVNTITVVDAGDATSGSTGLSGSDFYINLTSYGTALTLDASALDAANKDNNGSDGITSADSSEEKLFITGIASKALTVTGGAGTDTIVGSADADAGDTLKGGAGADTFTMNDDWTYEDTIDGGAGTDVITTAAAVTDVQFMNVTNLETLDLTAATAAKAIALGSYFSSSGISTVNLDGSHVSTVTATGTTSGVTYVVDGSNNVNDVVTGGIGDDTISYDNTTLLTAADAFVGGAGTDTIELRNSGGSVTGIIGLKDSTGFEKVVVKDADSGDTAGSETAHLVKVTFSGESEAGIASDNSTDDTDVAIEVDGSVITDKLDVFEVIASDVADPDYSFTIKGGAGKDKLTGGGGADTITGGSEADTILGGGGADTIKGDAGDDEITGGAGQDTITGGDGSDDFNYTFANTDSTQSKPDTITDFTTGSDEIRISYTAGKAAATFDYTNQGSASSVADAIGLLSGAVGQYVFNTSTNQLLIDIDGNGLLQSGDTAITLTGISALADADIAFDITTLDVDNNDASGFETITTGKGNDTITSAVEADVIDTGAGDDILNISGLTYTGGSFALGTGTDTIAVTGASSVTTALTITGAEKVTMAADTDFTVSETTAANFVAVDGFTITGDGADSDKENFVVKAASAGATTLDISGLTYTNIDTTTIDLDHASDDLKTANNTSDTFVYTGAFTDFSAATKIDGGSGGTDVLDVNSSTALSIASGTIVGIETLDLISGTDITMTNAQLQGFSTVKGDTIAGDVIIGVDGAVTALDVSGKTHTTITTNNSIDNNADSMVMATAGTVADTFVIPVSTAITATAAFNITGGGGADVLDINAVGATHATDLRLGTISSVETLNLDDGGVDAVVSLTGAQLKGFSTAVTAASTDIINISTVNTLSMTLTDAIDNLVIGSAETVGTITGFSMTGEVDTIAFGHGTSSGTGYVETGAASAVDSGTAGVVIFDANVAGADGTGLTAGEAYTALISAADNLASGEQFIAGVTADIAASDTLEFYHITVAANGTSFAAPTLLGTLAGMGNISDLAAANFVGFS